MLIYVETLKRHLLRLGKIATWMLAGEENVPYKEHTKRTTSNAREER